MIYFVNYNNYTLKKTSTKTTARNLCIFFQLEILLNHRQVDCQTYSQN